MIYHESVNFPFCLAPMVGLSHVGMRSLIQDYMPAGATTWWPTEMLNSKRIPTQELGTTPLTLRSERDAVLIPQILGNDERAIAKSVIKLEEFGSLGIDINMGCPVRKALKHNYGVSLMGDPSYAADVVGFTVAATSLPVSVKLRAGEQGNEKKFLEFTNGLVSSGAKVLCLHPRTQKQKRRGKADWSQITLLKENTSVPVIGNGDIQVWQDCFAMREETGCDGVMVGRALTARPWMFWQVGESLGLSAPIGREGEVAPQTLQEEAYEYGRALEKFVHYCFFYFELQDALKRIYFYIKVSSVWLNFGHSLSKKVCACKEEYEMKMTIKSFFSHPGLSFSRYTDLRY